MLAKQPSAQNLWRSQSRGGPKFLYIVAGQTLVLDNDGVTEIRDKCTSGLINKDVGLAEHKCGDDVRYRVVTYPSNGSMNHVA